MPTWSPNGKEIAFVTWDNMNGISEIRSLRVEKNIPVKSFPKLFLKNVNLEKKNFISNNIELITNLAKLEKIIFSDDEKLIE